MCTMQLHGPKQFSRHTIERLVCQLSIQHLPVVQVQRQFVLLLLFLCSHIQHCIVMFEIIWSVLNFRMKHERVNHEIHEQMLSPGTPCHVQIILAYRLRLFCLRHNNVTLPQARQPSLITECE